MSDGTDPVSPTPSVAPTTSRRPLPVVPRWIKSLPTVLYAALLVGLFALLVLLAVLVNPGHEVGPVQPSQPPVGGPELPGR